MKTTHIHVDDFSKAFTIAENIIGHIEYDKTSSEGAGYPIYRGKYFYDYACDLGDRLEINTKENHTFNIWLDTWKAKEGRTIPNEPKKEEAPKTDNRTMTVLVTLPNGKKMVRTATPSAVWEMLRDGATVEKVEVE